MNNTNLRGFSLIELMAVVTIVGIVSMVTIPKIVQVRYRNALIETVNNVQEGAALARDLALQTRNAAVLEVRPGKAWVNLLDGAYCSADIDRRCHRGFSGTDEFGEMTISEGPGDNAGVAMCGGGARALSIGAGAKTCDELSLDVAGFGICYSGLGELYLRASQDANMDCNSGSPTQANPVWRKACGNSDFAPVAFEDGTNFDLYDGAIVIFNRYELGSCSGEVEDVRRGVLFPSGGAPFSRLAAPEVAP